MQAKLVQPPHNIVLHGEVDRETLLKKMCQSDFLIFPSHTEGFPLTVLEAMTVGLPVIATRVGAIPDMIKEDEGGYLIEVNIVDALTSAVVNMSNDPDKRREMGAYNQHKSYHQYRYSIVSKKLQALYGQVLCAV